MGHKENQVFIVFVVNVICIVTTSAGDHHKQEVTCCDLSELEDVHIFIL